MKRGKGREETFGKLMAVLDSMTGTGANATSSTLFNLSRRKDIPVAQFSVCVTNKASIVKETLMGDQKRVPDAVRSQLRSVVAAVDYDVSHLEAEFYETTERLKNNWDELLTLLVLGPEPEYRECASCHNIGMRLATRRGFCWAKFTQ